MLFQLELNYYYYDKSFSTTGTRCHQRKIQKFVSMSKKPKSDELLKKVHFN